MRVKARQKAGFLLRSIFVKYVIFQQVIKLMLQNCCAAIFASVIASEGEATQLMVPKNVQSSHRIILISVSWIASPSLARTDEGTPQTLQRCNHLFNCSNCAIPNFATP
jgi:hypothetical protein